MILPETQKLVKMIDAFGYAFDPADTFRALVSMGMNALGKGMEEERDRLVKPYMPDYHQELNALFYQLMKAYKEGVGDIDGEESEAWYDPLGDIYQDIASRSKRSWMGQFFTPEHVCTMMAKMTIKADDNGLTYSDPCCGSGRMLLAAKALAPDNRFYGEDLDPLCCRMTVLNMAMHGCEGEVVCHNSLMPDTFREGWQLRKHLYLPMIEIVPIQKENSIIIRTWEQRKVKLMQETQPVAPQMPKIEIEEESPKPQLQLF